MTSQRNMLNKLLNEEETYKQPMAPCDDHPRSPLCGMHIAIINEYLTIQMKKSTYKRLRTEEPVILV